MTGAGRIGFIYVLWDAYWGSRHFSPDNPVLPVSCQLGVRVLEIPSALATNYTSVVGIGRIRQRARSLCMLTGVPIIECTTVLYITYSSSMQELILQGMQQKLQKSSSRCNKNTLHGQSNYILQPPNDLFPIVNRFRYTKNNVTKVRFSILMDATVIIGPLIIYNI